MSSRMFNYTCVYYGLLNTSLQCLMYLPMYLSCLMYLLT
jgi:hypothetical protein